MALILDCAAERVGKTHLKIVFNILEDYIRQEKRYFHLPKDVSAFKKFADELYARKQPIIPSKFNKKSVFIKEVVDYTLKQKASLISISGLNDYYDTIFAPTTEEDLKTLDSMADNAQTSFTTAVKEIQDLEAQRITAYKENQENKTPIGSGATQSDQQINDSLEPPERPPGAPKPKTRTQRPVYDPNLTSLQKQQLKNTPPGTAIKLKGVNGDRLLEGVPEGMVFPGDKLLKGSNNCGLHLTRDEEYRFKGHTNAGACYLYAGRAPGTTKLETKDGKHGPGSNLTLRTPNNLQGDASYLYLSQKADSKTLLGVAGGTYGKIIGARKGQSLAALKADDVVIAARKSGIRLITNPDPKGSDGGDLWSTFGVDLIAGNDDEDLQPLVKGDNLVSYLRGLSKSLDNLASVVYAHITSQVAFNASVAGHTHYDPFLILLGTMGQGNPLGVMGGKNLPSPETMGAGSKVLLEDLQQMQGAIAQAFNRINNDFNGLEPAGGYHIKSPANRTN